MDTQPDDLGANAHAAPDIHQQLGQLTRQLHNTLRELGLADKLRGTAEELPDAKSRLNYIARLTGEAAEKVLNRVDQAKGQHEQLGAETRRLKSLLVQDPVAAVAKGHVMNYLGDVEQANQAIDEHLTEIMMAQDFHDLTGQVIKRVVNLASTIEEQLIAMLIQTAPLTAHASGAEAPAGVSAGDSTAHPALQGPVVDTNTAGADVVTDQSQVDDLLASLGF